MRGSRAGRNHAVSRTSTGVPGPDQAGAVGDHVLAEDELLSEPAASAEHLERLRADLAGDLVGGGDDAPPAGLDDAELDGADADAAPVVLGPGRGPGHHRVGPEPGHRDGLRAVFAEPAAEFVERGGAGQQQRVPVGEADDIPVPPELGVHRPSGRIIQVDQAHRAAEIGREPGVTCRSRGGGQHGGAPDGDLQHVCAVPGGGRGDLAAGEAGRRDADRPGERGDHHPGQRGLFALAHEPAVLVDQEPPAVARQAPGLDEGLAQVDGAGRLHRVDVDRGEADARLLIPHPGIIPYAGTADGGGWPDSWSRT